MMKRRDFLKLSAAGVATLVVGSRIPGFLVKDAYAAAQTLDVVITDAVKEMATHNSINTAECYFWIYQMTADKGTPNESIIPAECPGPSILTTLGDSITIKITNALDEPHSFFIPGRLPTDPPMFDSGPIAPGASFSGTLTASISGCHLYYDKLNEPVNRVMGLHGAIIIRPSAPASGHKYTPYDNPTPHVQAIFDDFGTTSHWPGLAWEDGSGTEPVGQPGTSGYVPPGPGYAPPFRQYCWITHEASPNLFAEVGNYTPGLNYPAQQFMDKFLKDPFSPTRNNNIPQFFTINGQSGFFSHFSPTVTPMGRVGEPCVVHIMSAGLWTHSMHLHANHMFVTSVNNVPSANPIWVDVYTVRPMDKVDYTIPFMRPPDNPNIRGIGLPDTPLTTLNGHPVYPPIEEFEVYMPALGNKATNGAELGQRQSPLCYPMHDHSEPSQTAQGGNYNCGLISGMYILGDRNTPGHMDFPMDDDFKMMYRFIRGCHPGTYPAPGEAP